MQDHVNLTSDNARAGKQDSCLSCIYPRSLCTLAAYLCSPALQLHELP